MALIEIRADGVFLDGVEATHDHLPLQLSMSGRTYTSDQLPVAPAHAGTGALGTTLGWLAYGADPRPVVLFAVDPTLPASRLTDLLPALDRGRAPDWALIASPDGGAVTLHGLGRVPAFPASALERMGDAEVATTWRELTSDGVVDHGRGDPTLLVVHREVPSQALADHLAATAPRVWTVVGLSEVAPGQEHLAERLGQRLARCGDHLPPGSEAPLVLEIESWGRDLTYRVIANAFDSPALSSCVRYSVERRGFLGYGMVRLIVPLSAPTG